MIMCGRFTMTRRDRSELATSLGIQESELGDYAPRYNIAPTQPYFVVTTEYENRKGDSGQLRSGEFVGD
jgi:putative SOS response-associated peptidase YedK